MTFAEVDPAARCDAGRAGTSGGWAIQQAQRAASHGANMRRDPGTIGEAEAEGGWWECGTFGTMLHKHCLLPSHKAALRRWPLVCSSTSRRRPDARESSFVPSFDLQLRVSLNIDWLVSEVGQADARRHHSPVTALGRSAGSRAATRGADAYRRNTQR